MKILELTNYSAGVCGVWTRVLEEARILSKENEVMIFSSSFIKGSSLLAKKEETLNSIKIKRFKAFKLGGESFMYWNYEKEALKFKPDLIIAHVYRHFHTSKALKIGKKLGAKVFLVTHAPFVEDNTTRSFFASLFVQLYDFIIGPFLLNKFDKVITITSWEVPYLLRLGLDKNKISYLPNRIPDLFFKQPLSRKEGNTILFLGRVSLIKNLETLLKAMSLIEDKNIKLEIVGPAEEEYLSQLKGLINELGLQERILFLSPIFDIKEKIKKIDSAKIFILPSLREGMPQSLIEAMAREKVVISSDNPGSKELVKDQINGYLFQIGNEKELAEKINFVLKNEHASLCKHARTSVEIFNWDESKFTTLLNAKK